MQIKNTSLKARQRAAGICRDVLARWVSTLFSPLVIIIGMLCMITLRVGTATAWMWSGIAMGIGVAIPLLYIYTQTRWGKISNLNLSIRKQRIRPLLL